MVNRKLSEEDENEIYFDWLRGSSLVEIEKKYPVVISTIQRVIKKKSRYDGTKKNIILATVFKHLKNSNDPLILALKIFKENDENVHEKQKEYLMEYLNLISKNLQNLIQNIEKLNNFKKDDEKP